MQIISGLFDHGVLQRGGTVVVAGATDAAAGRVTAVATKGGRRVAQASAPIHTGRFTLRFARWPAGGPYSVTLLAGSERLVVKDVLVGDVWICAGQSNMQGVGNLRDAARPQPMVRAFYMDDRWAVARDPIHNLSQCVDEAHLLLNGGKRPEANTYWGAGPAVSFGQELWRRTGVPQGLLACAHGGTSMVQWSPQGKADGAKSLYGATLRRVAKNGGRVAGMLWYQGENEAGLSQDVAAYTARMCELVKELRSDLRAPRLPVVMAQIGRFVQLEPQRSLWNAVQDEQRRFPAVIPRLTVVPTIDLSLDDDIHVSGAANVTLGKRLAEAALALAGVKGVRPPITVRRVQAVADKFNGCGNVIVEFGNVAGKLVSAGRPTGFAIGRTPVVFDVALDGHRAVVRTTLPLLELTTRSLQYGPGFDPFCNISDAAGRPVPVFGPVPLGATRALTAFAKPRVSQSLPGAGRLDGLVYPANAESLTWRAKAFPKDFCEVHDEFGAAGSEDRLLYLACDVEVAEPMQLAALFGYDGPVKLWVDQRELFHDPNGTNPGRIDAKCIRFDAAPGTHRVLVALGSNRGQAWGIYLRFQRLGVTAAQVRWDPGAHRLPELR